jgi:hypothetical protein
MPGIVVGYAILMVYGHRREFRDVKPQTASHPIIRGFSALIAVLGVAVTVLALVADTVPVLGGGADGLGWKQLIAAIAGLGVAAVGIGWFLQPPLTRR